MTVAERRAGRACLPPVVLDRVVDDPESVRSLARRNAPYSFPDRPGGLVWPTWGTHWAERGDVSVAGADLLLGHERFLAAAADMVGTDRIEAQGLYVNLSTPYVAQPVSHTDMPEFKGVDRTTAPGWFLQAMGTSRLFEPQRISMITAVSWFFTGDGGYYRYWPTGRDGASVRQDDMWNTAVVGDNDFMHHKVERIGPKGSMAPPELDSSAVLDHDGDEWVVVQDGRVLARHGDDEVRLSVSWKGVLAPDDEVEPLTLAAVYERMAAEIGDGFAASSVFGLFSEPARRQLVARWPGFLPG